MEVPTENRIVKLKTVPVVKDHEEVKLHVFGTDVPLQFLLRRYRSESHVRKLASKRKKLWMSEGTELNQTCPVAATTTPLAIYDDETDVTKACHYSYGRVVTVEELQEALDGRNPDWMGGRPLRFGRSESPVWNEALYLYGEKRPVVDLQPRAFALNTQSPEERQRLKTAQQFLPKLAAINGKDEKELFDYLEGSTQSLQSRGVNPESPEGVAAVAGCFVGKLGRWFATQSHLLLQRLLIKRALYRTRKSH